MRSFSLLATATLALGAVVKRQGAGPSQVAQLGGWIETLAVRSNGQLLLNRLDVPELWTVDPATKESVKLLDFPGYLGLTGITEVSPDVFIVVAGNFSTTAFTLGEGSWALHKVDFTGGEAPTSELVSMVPEVGFVIGVDAFAEDNVFFADAAKGVLWKMNVATAEYGEVLADATMTAPAGSVVAEGIHGLEYQDGMLWFSNTFGNGFYKLPVDEVTGEATGDVESVIPNMDSPVDFAMGADGVAYVVTLNTGAVFKVEADGQNTKVADVQQGLSCAFGRGDQEGQLFIVTAGGNVLSLDI